MSANKVSFHLGVVIKWIWDHTSKNRGILHVNWMSTIERLHHVMNKREMFGAGKLSAIMKVSNIAGRPLLEVPLYATNGGKYDWCSIEFKSLKNVNRGYV